jgi:hypothetical protein
MAPTNTQSTQRGGTGSGRPYRNANTNAGVNRDGSRATRAAPRVRGPHRRPAHAERARPPANAPVGPTLASRMTFENSRGRGRGGIARGSTIRPRPQNGRRLQDRITRAGDDVAGGTDGGATGGSERAARDVQVNHRDRARNTRAPFARVMYAAPAPVPTSFETDVDINIDSDVDIDIDNITFNNSQFNTTDGFSQASAIFCGSQPTQLADAPIPLSPPTGPVHLTPPVGFTHLSPPPSAPTHEQLSPPTRRPPTAVATQLIRMVNHPIRPIRNDKERAEHPPNNYRGKDPIKQLVQNKKLQAVLAGKKVPGERKKHKDERMELIMK